MKKSYYNFIFSKEQGKSILYNSRTGAMAELDKEHTEQFLALAMTELEQENPEFAEALLQNGFAVEDEVSELDMIRYDILRARFGNQSLAVTLAPTQDCNFGCRYCYEKDVLQPQYMEEATQDAVVDYIEENLTMGSSLRLSWYGGEPLLALGIVESLTKKFLMICEEKKAEYKADIITNGYLLTAEAVKRLLACRITKFQITLDGNESTHDLRRPLADGSPTYRTIWENILALKDFRESIKVALRVNVDKNNKKALFFVKHKIAEEGMEDFVFVYPGRVMETETCHNSGECYSSREFAILEQEFSCSDLELLRNYYPHPRQAVCSAENGKSVVFDANGNMYKCILDIGREERSFGNVKEDGVCHEQVLHQYLLSDITAKEECAKCKHLPICMGGCPYIRLEGKNSCTGLRYTLDAYMQYLPQSVRQQEV